MKIIRYTLAVAWKEIQIISRDRGSLAILFLMPILIGGIFGGINYQANRPEGESNILFDVHLVNQDTGIFGEQLEAALNDIDILNILPPGSVDDTEQDVAEGKAAAAIIIPASFTQDIDSYTPTQVEVIVDPAVPESTKVITGILNEATNEIMIWGEIQYGVRTVLGESGVLEGASQEVQQAVEGQTLGVIMTQLNEMRRDPAILVDNKTLEGVKVEGGIELFFALLYPGLAVMFVFFILTYASSSLLLERETGTLRRILAAPIPRGAILGGKMLAYILVACIQVALLLAVGALLFDMPMGQSPLALVVLTLVIALVATSMGVFIAALSKDSNQAGNVGLILAFVLAAIGGSIPLGPVPLTRTEGFMSIISRFTPHSYAVEGYYSVLVENAGLGQIWPQVVVLLAMAVAFFLIATWRFRFE